MTEPGLSVSSPIQQSLEVFFGAFLFRVADNINETVLRLNTALPDTQVFVQSILPHHRDFISVMALSVNRRLQNLEGVDYTFINLYPHFVDSKTTNKRNLTSDGTHLTKAGYELWKSIVTPYMNKL